MARLSVAQKASFSLIDFLYLHDTAILLTSSRQKEEFYSQLSKKLDEVTKKRGFSGVKEITYQHFILCCLEMIAGCRAIEINCLRQGSSVLDSKFHYDMFLKNNTICAVIQKKEVKKYFKNIFNEFKEDIGVIKEEFDEFIKIEPDITYKLTAQYIFYKFRMCTSLCVFTKLLMLETIKCSHKRNTSPSETMQKQIFEVFFRSMLLIEFEIYRKQIFFYKLPDKFITNLFQSKEIVNEIAAFRESLCQTIEYMGQDYQSIADINNFDDKKTIEVYIKSIHERLAKKNTFFIDGVSDSTGQFIGWLMSYIENTNKENSIDVGKNIEQAKSLLNQYGLHFEDTTTYIKHFEAYHKKSGKVKELFKSLSEFQIGMMTPDITYFYFLLKYDNIEFPDISIFDWSIEEVEKLENN